MDGIVHAEFFVEKSKKKCKFFFHFFVDQRKSCQSMDAMSIEKFKSYFKFRSAM